MSALASVAERSWWPRTWMRAFVRARLQTWLTSRSPQVVARAASIIAQQPWPGFVTPLLHALQTWGTQPRQHGDVVCLFLLDALAQSDAAVPGALLRPLLAGTTAAAAFVLLAKRATSNELRLLASFRDSDVGTTDDHRDLCWVAAGNLLCTLRTPGFAAQLLRAFEWRLTVQLNGAIDRRPAREDECIVSGGSHAESHAGFPPLPAYSLGPSTLGGELLANGTQGVAFRRRLATTAQSCGVGAINMARRLRVEWLRALAEGAAVPADTVVALPFTGPADLRQSVAAQIDEIHAARRRLFAALRTSGAVTPAEAVAANHPLVVTLVAGEPLGDELRDLTPGTSRRRVVPA